MSTIGWFWRAISVAALGLPCLALAQQAIPAGEFVATPVAERTVRTLPAGPLYWRVERFATVAEARKDANPNALFVETPGAAWRFTLASGKAAGSTGTLVAQIGPVPAPAASEYLLRVNRAGGLAGAKTPVHAHPGSEAFFVLSGTLCQRTEHGTARLETGESMNGHMPGMTMQLTSCGTGPLDQFVLFVVDAQKPFSVPAQFK